LTLKDGNTQKANHEHTKRLHEQRMNGNGVSPPDLEDPELAAAYHSLQLHWLRTVPGYKDLIRERVSEAAKRAERLSNRIDAQYEERDFLGREVEGCG